MAEPQDPTLGAARRSLKALSASEIAELQARQRLVVDSRRRRANQFDGRFLTARDFVREQSYALLRQADVAHAFGGGVMAGLGAHQLGNASVRIDAGFGTTRGGELLRVAQPITLELARIPELAQLDASDGLSELESEPPSKRTGLYALVLRPVEYAEGSAVVYPTGVQGKRTKTLGDLREGVAVALVRLHEEASTADAMLRRSELARALFVRGMPAPVASDLLPLAALWIERGVLRAFDPWLLRREIAADRASSLTLLGESRALREAHLQQYGRQLREAIMARQGSAQRFAAADVFRALPAAGPLPASAVDLSDFTQGWFPPEMSVVLSIVPDDEIPVLIEEALALAPIDLVGEATALDNTRIHILVPMSQRALLEAFPDQATERARAVPLLPSRRTGQDVLATIVPVVEPDDEETLAERERALTVARAAEASWRKALAASGAGILWYVRARTLELNASLLFPPKEEKETKEKEKDTKEGKEKDTKEGKEKDTKEGKEKDTKEGKEKDTKEGKEKDTKEGKEKDTKEGKEKDTKEGKEKEGKDKELTKEAAKDILKDANKETSKDLVKELEKDDRENKPIKDFADKPRDEKVKDLKEREDKAKDLVENPDRLREDKAFEIEPGVIDPERFDDPRLDPRTDVRPGLDLIRNDGGAITALTNPAAIGGAGNASIRGTTRQPRVTAQPRTGPSRTFIQPAERPLVGGRALTDEPEDR